MHGSGITDEQAQHLAEALLPAAATAGKGDTEKLATAARRKDKTYLREQMAAGQSAASVGLRRRMGAWLMASAKRPETRAKRLGALVEACAAGERLF